MGIPEVDKIVNDEFADWNEFAGPPLTLPINGKLYKIPPVGIKTALILLHAVDNQPEAIRVLTQGDAFYRAVLGSAYDELQADDVDEKAVDRAALTALVDFKHGRMAALVCWRTGSDPEALGRFVAASRAIVMIPAEADSSTQ